MNVDISVLILVFRFLLNSKIDYLIEDINGTLKVIPVRQTLAQIHADYNIDSFVFEWF